MVALTQNGCSHSPYEDDLAFEDEFPFEDDWAESEENFIEDDYEDFEDRIRNEKLIREDVEALQNQQEVLIAKARELEELMFMMDVQLDTTQGQIEDNLPESGRSDFMEQDIEELRAQIARLNDELARIQSKKAGKKLRYSGNSAIPLEYQLALSAFHSGKYEESILKFQDLAMDGPQKSLKDNIEYWVGCNYVKLDMHNDAIRQFETVLRDYPDGNKVHDSRYMLGISHYYNGRSYRAIEILENALEFDPPFEIKNKIIKRLEEIQETENNISSTLF